MPTGIYKHKRLSPETKEKLRQARQGKKLSEEMKNYISESRTGIKCNFKNSKERKKAKRARYYLRHKEILGRTAKEERNKFFNLCLDHYGHSCSLCDVKENLCIDHIAGNNGNSPKGDRSLWLWIIKNNFPDGYRTLCKSCNRIDGQIRHHPLLGKKGIDDVLQKLTKLKEVEYALSNDEGGRV